MADTWTDAELKDRLLKDPRAVLKGRGMTGPEGAEFRALEDSEEVIHLILPPVGQLGELSEEELAAVAGRCEWPPRPYWLPRPPFPPTRALPSRLVHRDQPTIRTGL